MFFGDVFTSLIEHFNNAAIVLECLITCWEAGVTGLPLRRLRHACDQWTAASPGIWSTRRKFNWMLSSTTGTSSAKWASWTIFRSIGEQRERKSPKFWVLNPQSSLNSTNWWRVSVESSPSVMAGVVKCVTYSRAAIWSSVSTVPSLWCICCKTLWKDRWEGEVTGVNYIINISARIKTDPTSDVYKDNSHLKGAERQISTEIHNNN